MVALGAAGLVAGCSYPREETPYAGQCATMTPVAYVPAPNSVAVPTDVVFRIRFNDYPDPDTVRSDSLLLTTGYFWVPGSYGVDLIAKTAVMRPVRPLVQRLGYALHLRPDLASLAGCGGTSREIEFITGDGASGEQAPPPPPFADVQAIFTARCGGGCHLGDASDAEACLAPAAAGLSLCPPESRDAMVGIRSRQVGQLPLVEPGDSARSYLLRKLIPANPAGAPLTGVFGQREPPGDPLPEDQLRAIAAWIDGGALR
jgi:hypothetical protein